MRCPRPIGAPVCHLLLAHGKARARPQGFLRFFPRRPKVIILLFLLQQSQWHYKPCSRTIFFVISFHLPLIRAPLFRYGQSIAHFSLSDFFSKENGMIFCGLSPFGGLFNVESCKTNTIVIFRVLSDFFGKFLFRNPSDTKALIFHRFCANGEVGPWGTPRSGVC